MGKIRMYLKKRRRALSAVLCISALTVVLVFEAAAVKGADRYSYTGRLETDIVRVSIENFMLAEGRTVPAKKRTVMPNEYVSLIPRVTNLGTEAYVRVRIESSSSAVSEDDVYGLSRGWVRRGKYFYLKEPLSTGEMADLFEGFHVPADADEKILRDFFVIGSVDAVQSGNFSPAYSDEKPWGNLDISASKNESSMVFSEGEKRDEYILTYDSDGFHGDTDNLFEGFSVRVDGDREKGRLRILNRSGSDILLSFSSACSGKLLSQKMNVGVYIDGKEIYEGRISDMGETDFERISIKDNGVRVLGYEIELPEKSGNLYSNLSDTVRWTFKAEKRKKAPLTGDIPWTKALTVTALISALLFAVYIYLRRKGKNESHQLYYGDR